MEGRGKYDNKQGRTKQVEILRTALELIAARGFRRTTLRELADAVELSPAGLLHHFGSRDDLFMAVLQEKEAGTLTPDAPGATLARLFSDMRVTRTIPGMSQLFSTLLVSAATEEEYAGREYFQDRYTRLLAHLTADLRAGQSDGSITDAIPAEILASLIVAVGDGMQAQYLLHPDFDLDAHLDGLVTLISGDAPFAGSDLRANQRVDDTTSSN